MQNHSPRLFQSIPDEKKNLTIVIDPDILLIADSTWKIHPVLEKWLDDILAKCGQKPRFYFLVRIPGNPGVGIYDCIFPFDQTFHDRLNDSALKYLDKIWNGMLQFADMSEDSESGFMICSDGHVILRDEVLLVTGNEGIFDFYKEKNIAVVCMDSICQILEFGDIPENENNVHTHCDFDGTLFNHCGHVMMKQYLHAISIIESTILLVQEKTILFLSENKRYPTFLLTQRSYSTDQNTHEYNNAIKVVDTINKMYELEIEANEFSYLNANEQLLEKNDFSSKIEFLLDKYTNLSNDNSLPKYIILIDDNINEIVVAAKLMDSFQALGITLKLVFVMLPTFYSKMEDDCFKKYCPDMAAEIKKLYLNELGKLEKGWETLLSLKKVEPEVIKADDADKFSCRLC